MRVSDPVSGMEAKFSFPISKGKNVFLSKTGSVLMDLFAGGAPRFDDITMLCMEYYGRTK